MMFIWNPRWLKPYDEEFQISIVHYLYKSVLLVKEAKENHLAVTSHLQTLSNNFVWGTPCREWDLTLNISGDSHRLHR
jgi:hypothetical protein